MHKQRAVVLLSGGLDSATVLAVAQQDFDCYSLSFDYGQCAQAELIAAQNVARHLQVIEHRVAKIDLAAFGGSALTDHSLTIPNSASSAERVTNQGVTECIPITYVPARNTIFLSYALAWAEVLDAQAIFIGVNAVDYSGYPDCRPDYIAAFQTMANLATKQAVEGRELNIHTPLIHLSKAEIIQLGQQLNVDYGQTISCYQANERGAACGVCDSCFLRRQGFTQAGVDDPTVYQH